MISLRTLRWISVVMPTAFVVLFELVTRAVYGDLLPAWGHTVVILSAVSAGAFAFSRFVFRTMSRLEGEILERNRRLALLNAVSVEASESPDLERVGLAITRNIARAFNATAVGIALLSEDDGELRLVSQAGLAEADLHADGRLGAYDCECRRALGLGETVVVTDSRESGGCAAVFPPGTCVAAPVRSKGKNIGAVLIARPRTRPFGPDDVELISALAAQMGPVLQNAQLFSNTEAIAVLRERQRVAREVHDGLAQTMGYLNVQMGIIDHLLAGGEVTWAQAELEAMAAVTRDAYEDLRQSIMDLGIPAPPGGGGLERILRDYAERFSRQTGVVCHLEGRAGLVSVAPSAEVQLVRILQEALNNVKKHAPGAEVWISLDNSAGILRMRIRDNGPGFDESATGGMRFGLRSMRERAESVGGSLNIETRLGAGTRLEVTVPAEAVRAA